MSDQGDIYQLKLTTVVKGETCLNVFYYEYSGAESPFDDALVLAGEFVADVLPFIQQLQSNQATATNVSVVNGMDNTDAYSEDISVTGTIATVALPPDIALGLRFRESNQVGKRYSYKRIPGIPSEALGDTGWANVGSVFLANIALLGGVLGDILTGAVGSFLPVQITGGFQLGVVPVRVQVLVGDWSYNDRPSSQMTRAIREWIAP